MNFQAWFVSLAQIAAQALSLAGQQALARIFEKIGAAGKASQSVEAHMAAVKANLDSGPLDQADWNAVEASIQSSQDRINRA